MTLPGGTLTTSTTYDEAGDVLTVTDPKGQETDNTYDRAGRLTTQAFLTDTGSTAETRVTTYDNDGNVLSQSDLNGTTSYSYNADNQQTSTTRDTTTSGIADDYTVVSLYDANGNRTQVIYPTTGRALDSVFDAANRMTSMIDSGDGTSDPGGTTTFAYDNNGNRVGETLPSGQTTTATFDALNNVTSLATAASDSSNIFNVSYGYDLAGQRISDAENLTGQSERDDTWTYDGLYRLTGESWTGPDAQAIEYTYDSAGNRLSQTATPFGDTPVTTDYTYDNLNELLTSTTGSDTTTYSYDLNGNRTAKTDSTGTTDYLYDTSNRLTQATQGGSTILTAAYDAAGNRIAATQDGTTTLYRYDGGVGTNFQEVSTSGQVNVEYVSAGGEGGGIGAILYSDRSMATTPGPEEYYAYDAIGNTAALTDNTGTPTQTTLYSAFGGQILQTGTSDNNRLHNTKQHDASTGLDYYGARYYDESTGTFTQRDPKGYVNGLNVYQSDNDNPVNRVDPQGLSWIPNWISSAASVTADSFADAVGINGGHMAGQFWSGAARGAEAGYYNANAVVSTLGNSVGLVSDADNEKWHQISDYKWDTSGISGDWSQKASTAFAAGGTVSGTAGLGVGVTDAAGVTTVGLASLRNVGSAALNDVKSFLGFGSVAATGDDQAPAPGTAPSNPGTAFPSNAQPGQTFNNIDPNSLSAGRSNLVASKLTQQQQLIEQGTERTTPITATPNGVIYDGNHGAAAAAQAGKSVTVQVVNPPVAPKSNGPITQLPVTQK